MARRQLTRAGLSRDAIDHLVAAGRLLPRYRGVYAVGHRPVGPRSREMAVVLITGVRALSWHRALGLWAMSRPWRGARLVNTAAPTKSRLERDLRKILHEHGLPQPISNGFVCGYEVDLHWPQHRLVAELDGYEFHAHRKASETDRERDIVLATEGWRTVRLTAAQLERRATVAERFSALLRAPALPRAA